MIVSFGPMSCIHVLTVPLYKTARNEANSRCQLLTSCTIKEDSNKINSLIRKLRKAIKLRFNPLTKTLSSNDGTFIKSVDCPIWISEHKLIGSGPTQLCLQCKSSIISISGMDDHEITNLIQNKEDQCLSFSLTDDNIRVTYDE